MASASDREYQLIEKLELRIASADSDAKFQAILQKFLAPLLLKLASENTRNRNLTIKVCQYISQRLKIDSTIALPIQSLLKTFREGQNAFIKRFALIFIEQGLGRTKAADAFEILPGVIAASIPLTDSFDSSDGKMWSVAFDYLLDTLQTLHIPDHATKEDTEFKDKFALTDHQRKTLSDMLSHFLLYDPKLPWAQSTLQVEFQSIFEKQFRTRPRVVLQIAKYLFSSIFTDEDRIVPATILSVDANASASSLADAMFKQCIFDLESDQTVDALFTLFDLGRPKLQIRVLSLLGRSRASTDRAPKILEIIEKQLFQGATGLEAAKLRASVFTYLNWAVRSSKNLEGISGRLQTILKEFIELQGWPTTQEASMAEIDLRSKAYEGIGLLASTQGSGSVDKHGASLDLVTWLFTSLRCDMTRDIKSSIDESLSRILNVIAIREDSERQKLKDLLLWNVLAEDGEEDSVYFLPTRYDTTYTAVRFANKCLPFADVDARYIDLLSLKAKHRREVVEEAMRGLDPYWHVANSRLLGSTARNIVFPNFTDFVSRVFSDKIEENILKNDNLSLAAAVTFGRNLLITEALSQTNTSIDNGSDWKQDIDALVSNDVQARDNLRAHLGHCDTVALSQQLEAAIYGLSLASSDCGDIAIELAALAPDAVLTKIPQQSIVHCRKALAVAAVQHRGSRVYGIIMSLSTQGATEASAAVEKCSGWAAAVGQEAVMIRGSLLCAGAILTRMGLRRSHDDLQSLTNQLMMIVKAIISDGRDAMLKHAAYVTLGQISLCLPTTLNKFDELSPCLDNLLAAAKKEDEIALHCIGRLINSGFATDNGQQLSKLTLDRLFTLHEIRKAEFHFALGEALAVAALGFRSTATMTEFDVDMPLPDTGHHQDLYETLLVRCITDCKTTKPSLKRASGIWLLCLIQYCSDAEMVRPHLRDCQAAFGGLLTNRDEIIQETGSRGLSLVYEKGDKNLQDDLVRDLVQSFTGGGPKMSGTVNEDTQLFEAGALPTEGGQSVTTYKDIVSLATEMGDPSLVYRFMNLASNNAIWTSRAAFGRFGLSGVLANSDYLTQNKKFYPKLFRYRFDPNPNVQRSMNEIWKALVKDPNKVIEDNFDLIMEDLLKSVVSGKEWRAREASCGAIADLVQGREVEKFEKYLNDIWNVAFKVLDDVKESVRVAAMKLCRTLTSMLIRNLEVGEEATRRASIMLDRAIPFLLQQMEGGSAQEVQQYAVITLLEVVRKSPPRSLQSFVPTILETLVLSLSSLEHESINYLHLNADKYGLTAEKLDKMRVSSINASPVTEAIDRCLESLTIGHMTSTDNDEDSMALSSHAESPTLPVVEDTMQRLEHAFKTSIGLPSKVGLSRVIVTLVVRHHAMFRPFADRFARLTRKYILDRNATISVSFSMALAYLMRLATEQEIYATCAYAQKLYFESQELPHRVVAGEIVQAISKASNDVFMNFASTFLPFAFVGRNDTDEEVRGHFDTPWKDNIGGSRALNLYLKEIVELIDRHIKSSLWPVRQACCLAVAQLVTLMDASEQFTEVEALLLWRVVEESLSGKTWDGKAKVVTAFPKFVTKAKVLWVGKGKQMKTIALREAKRTNAVYRPHAIDALGSFVSARADLDLEDEVMAVMTNVSEGLRGEKDGDEMELDVGKDESFSSRLEEDTWMAMVRCLFQVLSLRSKSEVLDQAVQLVRQAKGYQTPRMDVEVYSTICGFIQRTSGTRLGHWGSLDLSAGVGVGVSVGAGVGVGVGAGHAQCANLLGEEGEPQRHPATVDEKESHRESTSTSTSASNSRSAPQTRQAAVVSDSAPIPHRPIQLARFLHQIVAATFDTDMARHSSDNEKTRKSRVDLAGAVARCGWADGVTCNRLASILNGWSGSERSRPLKMETDETVQALKSSQGPP